MAIPVTNTYTPPLAQVQPYTDAMDLESKMLTWAIYRLDRGTDKEWYRAVTDLIPVTNPYLAAGKPPFTIAQAREELLIALRKYSAQFVNAWKDGTKPQEIYNELATLKGKLLYAHRPKPIIDLNLNAEQTFADWPAADPQNPIAKFPSYFKNNPHPSIETVGGRGMTDTANYNEALHCIEALVPKLRLDRLNANDLKKALIYCYNALQTQTSFNEENFYRKTDVFCYREGDGKHLSKFAQEAAVKGDHEGAAALYELVKDQLKFDQYGPHHWTAFVNHVGYVPPAPDEVPGYIDQFCTLLRTHLDKDPRPHPYVIAKFIHNGITAIHPVADANGRMARLFMNTYLMQQGLTPFMPLLGTLYMARTAAPLQTGADSFANYLHQTIQLNKTAAKTETMECKQQ